MGARHKMQISRSIKNRLIAAVSFLLIILVSVISFVTLAQFERNTKDLIEQQQFTTVTLLANEIDDKMTSTLDLLTATAGLFQAAHITDGSKAGAFLQEHSEIKTVFNNGVFLFDRHGSMIAETQKSGRVGQDFSFREYLATSLQIKKPYIGNPYISSQAHKHPAVMLTAPIFDGTGALVGVLAGSIDLMADNVLGRLIDLRNGKTGYFFLITKDRNLILHPDRRRIMSHDVSTGANKSLEKAIKGFEGSEQTVTSKGVPSIASYKLLKSKNWIVGANYPVAEAFAPIYTARNMVIAAIVFITALVSFIVWHMMNVLTRPLLDFTRHVESIGEKQGDERLLKLKTGDEIGKLATAFNNMVTNLDTQQLELLSQKERLSVTVRSIADGVIVTDEQGCLVMMNRVAEKLTGWPQSEVIGRPLDSFFAIIDEKLRQPVTNPVQLVLENGAVAVIPLNTILVSRHGAEHFIADSCAPIMDTDSRTIGAVLVFQDITEKRRMHEESTRAEKLESIGVLAGGIAHDFNNLLTAILGNISLVKMMLPQGSEKLTERLNAAEFASLRAKDLTQRLLTFSQGGAPVRKSFHLPALIRNYAGLALSGSKAICDYDIPDDLWAVYADEGQIGQVISNLVINADQAMPDGGRITITCRNSQIDSDTRLTLHPGQYIEISIRDEGTGIANEHLKRIFEPYFTSKENGCGLGLATVYSIMQNHGGHIIAESSLGIGTTFTLYLPASDSIAEQQEARHDQIARGNGRLLVMDDEAGVRTVASEMLAHLGYEVALACDGQQAVDMYCQALNHAPFDLVIMDLTIPGGMGGKEAMQALRGINPDIKALVSSGYSNDPILANYGDHGFCGAVLKPYKVEELSQAVQRALSL